MEIEEIAFKALLSAVQAKAYTKALKEMICTTPELTQKCGMLILKHTKDDLTDLWKELQLPEEQLLQILKNVEDKTRVSF